LLLAVPPFLISPTAREAFRLPKLMASEWLALLSLVFLAWAVSGQREVNIRRLGRSVALRIVVPILIVATLTLATTAAPHFVRDGLIDLWIGAACLAGWSLAFKGEQLRRLLHWMMVPAVVLAAIGVLQVHGATPLEFLGQQTQRLGVTSLAGNPGDLGAYLLLPCLLAQVGLLGKKRRWLWALALVLCGYALVVTQTFTAIAGLGLATAVLWWRLLPRRRALAILGGGAVLLALAVLTVAPLRSRVAGKVDHVRRGDINRVLTGRLDGWWAAVWMVHAHPLTGVGHGAYRASFSEAKLALTDDGVTFLSTHNQPFFSNAHNEYLEVAAEWGLPGVVALLWALWLLFGCLRRMGEEGQDGDEGAVPAASPSDRALAWSAVAGFVVVALASFPFRIALTAFPILVLLAWIVRAGGGWTPRPAAPKETA